MAEDRQGPESPTLPQQGGGSNVSRSKTRRATELRQRGNGFHREATGGVFGMCGEARAIQRNAAVCGELLPSAFAGNQPHLHSSGTRHRVTENQESGRR